MDSKFKSGGAVGGRSPRASKMASTRPIETNMSENSSLLEFKDKRQLACTSSGQERRNRGNSLLINRSLVQLSWLKLILFLSMNEGNIFGVEFFFKINNKIIQISLNSSFLLVS